MVVTGATPAQADAFVRRLDRGLRGADIAASIGAAPYTFAHGFVGAWDEADRAMHAAKRRLRLAS